MIFPSPTKRCRHPIWLGLLPKPFNYAVNWIAKFVYTPSSFNLAFFLFFTSNSCNPAPRKWGENGLSLIYLALRGTTEQVESATINYSFQAGSRAVWFCTSSVYWFDKFWADRSDALFLEEGGWEPAPADNCCVLERDNVALVVWDSFGVLYLVIVLPVKGAMCRALDMQMISEATAMLTGATGKNRDINHIAGIESPESFIMFYLWNWWERVSIEPIIWTETYVVTVWMVPR